MEETSKNNQTAQLGIGVVSNSCLICGKELDKETAEHGNGTCSEYCNAKYSGYPMPSDYSEGLQKLVDNCCEFVPQLCPVWQFETQIYQLKIK